MTQIIEKHNPIIPEKVLDTTLTMQPHYKFGVQNTITDATDTINTSVVCPTGVSDTYIPLDNIDKCDARLSNLHFFSSSEATLCSQIIKAIQKDSQTLFVSLPTYAQDKALAERIGDYITLPNTKSVVINADGLNASQIISEYIAQLSLAKSDNMYHEFAHLMRDYFRHGFVLHSVIYNAHSLTKQDFDYLYELASIIYEKFPKQRHKPLMRFIFIGDKKIAPILRKKTNSKFEQFTVSPLTITECVNALYLYTTLEARTELFYQTVGTNAAAMRIATAGYPALLRFILPMPDAPSLSDRRNPESYLTKIVNQKIDAKYHKDLNDKRLFLKRNHHFSRSRTYIRLLLSSVIVGLLFYAYYIM